MFKGLIIFGAGIYTGVYIAQNYQGTVDSLCKKTKEKCDKMGKKWLVYIDKVEDPKVLFEKAQSFIKKKFDGSKRDDC